MTEKTHIDSRTNPCLNEIGEAVIFNLSEHTDTTVFFGINNNNIQLIRHLHPNLRIVARGHVIKINGSEEDVKALIENIERLELFALNNNSLSEENIVEIIKGNQPTEITFENLILHGVHGKSIMARTANQQKLVRDFETNDLLFAIGPAGSGKTYTAIALAVKSLKNKEIKKIILSRPAVEAGEKLGFLPGDMKEKLDPYMQPLYDALRDMLPNEKLEDYILKGIIQIAPLAFMRGRTLDNAFVILDEAQNTTHSQMKMFLTRMGKSAKFMITGDPGQVDLPRRTISGLKEALLVLKDIDGIGIIYLDDKDIVRHRLVKKVIDAYKMIENND